MTQELTPTNGKAEPELDPRVVQNTRDHVYEFGILSLIVAAHQRPVSSEDVAEAHKFMLGVMSKIGDVITDDVMIEEICS
jgi:hypothetical protein